MKDRERLEREQHRFTSMLLGVWKLKLLTLEEKRNRSDLVELFKLSKVLSAVPWN